MNKIIITICTAAVVAGCNQNNSTVAEQNVDTLARAEAPERIQPDYNAMKEANFHQFQMQALDGSAFDFSTLKGKRVLVVNTASECGYTPQYESLQELYDTYKEKNFVVLGFPSNDFGKQEPGTDTEIATFCKKNFGVTFPMMTKSIVSGPSKNDIYKWLTMKELNGKKDAEVQWNFNKFLIDEEGQWVAWYPSNVEPTDERIIAFAEGKSI